jgi:serine/threonine-protein kinase
MTHPSLQQLRQLLTQALHGDERERVEGHVNSCDECLEHLEALQRPGAAELRRLAVLLLDPPPGADGDDRAGSDGEASTPSPEACPLPAAWSDFAGHAVLARVGGGGMGEVYQARHRRTHRAVALKTIQPGRSPDDPAYQECLARFRAEAEAVSRLQHPHIVALHEAGEHDGRLYFTMEWVAGGTLAEKLNGRPQPARAAAAWVRVLAEAIHHAHQHHIVHRDLKPANILLAPVPGAREPAWVAGQPLPEVGAAWVPKIADFGVARLLDRGGGLTQPVQAVGTPEYMAPEQTADPERPGAIGPATDVYALGVLLYELLTGRPPFRAASPLETVKQVRIQDPVPPRRWLGHLSRDLETICLKCLEKDPARRYATALALAEDLRRFHDGEPIKARPPGRLKRAWRWARRRPEQVLRLVLAALLVLALTLMARSMWAVRAGQTDQARDLARSLDGQLQVVNHAVVLTARQDRLRSLLARPADDPRQRRRELQAFLESTKADFNQWFTWSGKEPLVNLFVMDADGTILADSFAPSSAVGLNFRDRDYARLLGDPRADRDAVFVSRVYRSTQDDWYKFAVVTGIWDGDRFLGLLAAGLPIDSKLVALDLKAQPPGVLVACPMDWTYTPGEDAAGTRHYLAVLHPDYDRPGRDPVWVGDERREALQAFATDAAVRQKADHVAGHGCVVDYARVGGSPFVVAVERPYPEPLGFLVRHAMWAGVLALVVGGATICLWRRRRDGIGRQAVGCGNPENQT